MNKPVSDRSEIVVEGSLGCDPEWKQPKEKGGKLICRFRLASDDWDENGVRCTDWFRVEPVGELGNFCFQQLKEGDKVRVEGRVKLVEWYQSKDDKRANLLLVAKKVELLESKAKRVALAGAGGNAPDDTELSGVGD